jgi:hypothetical protein
LLTPMGVGRLWGAGGLQRVASLRGSLSLYNLLSCLRGKRVDAICIDQVILKEICE